MRDDISSTLDAQLYPTESEHQRDIEQHFGDALSRPLSDKETQLLASLDIFFVAFSNRSGSTLLSEMLFQCEVAVPPKAEVFNSDSVIPVCVEHGIPTFTDYFLQVVGGWHKAGLVGFKIGPRQLFWLTRSGLLRHFNSVKVINSLRRDRVLQAVSLYIARHTGQWQSHMDTRADADAIAYSATEIAGALRQITDDQLLIEYYAQLHGIACLKIVYEDLLADSDHELRRALDFLDVAVPANFSADLNAVTIERQWSAKNDELAQLFRQDFAIR